MKKALSRLLLMPCMVLVWCMIMSYFCLRVGIVKDTSHEAPVNYTYSRTDYYVSDKINDLANSRVEIASNRELTTVK